MSVRTVFANIFELIIGALIGGGLVFLIFSAASRENEHGITHNVNPHADSALRMDACSYSENAALWLRRDGKLCRGTGAQPVDMPARTITDVPDLYKNYPRSTVTFAEDHPLYNCRLDGDQVCGYGNSNNAPAGYYGTDHGIFNR